MHDPRTHLTADAGQIGAVVQQTVDKRAVLVAGGRVHREAGGLVQHDQVPVLIEDIQGNVLGNQVGKRLRRRHPELHRVVLTQGGFGPSRHPVDADIAGVDELLNPGPALLRALGHQPTIQAHRQGLGVGERQQLPFTFPKRTHGNSKAIGPSMPRRKSSRNRWAIRAVSPLVCRSAAPVNQAWTSG